MRGWAHPTCQGTRYIKVICDVDPMVLYVGDPVQFDHPCGMPAPSARRPDRFTNVAPGDGHRSAFGQAGRANRLADLDVG